VIGDPTLQRRPSPFREIDLEKTDWVEHNTHIRIDVVGARFGLIQRRLVRLW
jgi:hypothetical protein